MTQPDYVPIVTSDRVRPVDRLPAPAPWRTTRPAELGEQVPVGRHFGAAGPDLGYGLKLAKRFVDRLVLADGEHIDDAISGCFACGSKRAATFGRAPVIYDMEWAYTLWGFFPGAPEGLIAYRAPLFKGASHHYWDRRQIVERVRPQSFALTPQAVRERLPAWANLLYEA
jgi:hypothetical protein